MAQISTTDFSCGDDVIGIVFYLRTAAQRHYRCSHSDRNRVRLRFLCYQRNVRTSDDGLQYPTDHRRTLAELDVFITDMVAAET